MTDGPRPSGQQALVAAAHLVLGVLLLPLIVAAAAMARVQSAVRRRARARPRVIWGPTPVINIKYWSRALQARGLRSRTVVFDVYRLNTDSDFDVVLGSRWPRRKPLSAIKPYAAAVWSWFASDVFVFFYHGGFLQRTPWIRLELPLLRLAGKRTIAVPYGTDIAHPDHVGPFKEALLHDYPALAHAGGRIQRQVDHVDRWASLRIRNLQAGYQPGYDILWPTFLGIDVAAWAPGGVRRAADGRSGPVTVVHSANHRRLKGTDALVAAVRRLNDEGLDVRLVLLEKVPNEAVREAVRNADIVADQFIGGYGLAAVEAMSAARPVLSHLSFHPPDFIAATALRECPILDTSFHDLEANLRRLVTDPAERARRGDAGRAYVMRYHDQTVVGDVWADLVRRAWTGPARPKRASTPGHVPNLHPGPEVASS